VSWSTVLGIKLGVDMLLRCLLTIGEAVGDDPNGCFAAVGEPLVSRPETVRGFDIENVRACAGAEVELFQKFFAVSTAAV